MLPLPAPQKVKCFRVRFRFQLLSSKCFRFHKNLTVSTASASTLLLGKYTMQNDCKIAFSIAISQLPNYLHGYMFLYLFCFEFALSLAITWLGSFCLQFEAIVCKVVE